MKLKQALKIIESENKVISPECVEFIEDKIKHLEKRGMKKKASQWQEILKANHQKMINGVFQELM